MSYERKSVLDGKPTQDTNQMRPFDAFLGGHFDKPTVEEKPKLKTNVPLKTMVGSVIVLRVAGGHQFGVTVAGLVRHIADGDTLWVGECHLPGDALVDQSSYEGEGHWTLYLKSHMDRK